MFDDGCLFAQPARAPVYELDYVSQYVDEHNSVYNHDSIVLMNTIVLPAQSDIVYNQGCFINTQQVY